MKIAVIYQSHYGSTKQYANWIADELEAELLERRLVKPEQLTTYDMIIYGGGLYASGILGIDLVVKNPCPRLAIFTVGLANPKTTDYTEILDKNLPAHLRNSVPVFHLRGSMDYSKLGLVHRGMMAMMKRATIGNRPYEQLSDEDRLLVDTYGKVVNFTDRQSIQPLVSYVKSLAVPETPCK